MLGRSHKEAVAKLDLAFPGKDGSLVVARAAKAATCTFGLVRAKTNTTWKALKSFGRWDELVELTVSRAARRKDPTLPQTLVACAVSYRHAQSKGRQWLLTSLLDAKSYPATDIVAVYHERWEVELGYGKIKTQLLQNEETIRSRTVDGVEQELWGILLAYNLIRLDMERIAEQADVTPSRISFVAAMRFIRDEWSWCGVASPGSIPKNLQRMRDRVASSCCHHDAVAAATHAPSR